MIAPLTCKTRTPRAVGIQKLDDDDDDDAMMTRLPRHRPSILPKHPLAIASMDRHHPTKRPHDDKSSPPTSSVRRRSNNSRGVAPEKVIVETALTPYDVLCGRSSTCFNNIGNRRFRITIGINLPRYMAAKTRAEKIRVIEQVLLLVRYEIGVRFLKPQAIRQGGGYIELDDTKAREKVGHALRDLSVQIITGGGDGTSRSMAPSSSSLLEENHRHYQQPGVAVVESQPCRLTPPNTTASSSSTDTTASSSPASSSNIDLGWETNETKPRSSAISLDRLWSTWDDHAKSFESSCIV
jgi:hypothetical protein